MNLKNELKAWLKDQNNNDFYLLENENLQKYTSLSLVARGDILKIYSENFAINLFKKFKGSNFTILGKGANSIVKKENPFKVFIKLYLDNPPDIFNQLQKDYYLSASTSLSHIVRHAIDFNIKEWGVLAGIPGTLGGAVFMNAGTSLGEIGNFIDKIRIVKSNGEVIEKMVNNQDFSYRKNLILNKGDLITYVGIKSFLPTEGTSTYIKNYLQKRKETQPLSKKTCGSVFKNSNDYLAGQSIDLLGLKGLLKGDLSISHKHGNFIENHQAGNYSDFVSLTGAMKKELELIYGIKFELEARFL